MVIVALFYCHACYQQVRSILLRSGKGKEFNPVVQPMELYKVGFMQFMFDLPCELNCYFLSLEHPYDYIMLLVDRKCYLLQMLRLLVELQPQQFVASL